MTEMAPTPGGVTIAVIVSSLNFISYKNKQIKPQRKIKPNAASYIK